MILAITTGIEKKVENQLKKIFVELLQLPLPSCTNTHVSKGLYFQLGVKCRSSPSLDIHWKRAGRRWDPEHSIRTPGWTGLLWQVRENQERDIGLVEGSE